MQKRRPVEGSGAVLLASDEQALSNKTNPTPQPATVLDLRKANLIARHVRPELASAMALLVFGGAHG